MKKTTFILSALLATTFALLLWVLMDGFSQIGSAKKYELAFSFLTSLIGVLVAAGLAYWFALKQFSIQKEQEVAENKLAATIDHHNYFNSHDMLACRGQVERLLYENPEGDFQKLYDRLGEERTRSLFVLSRFYQRLQISIENDLVEERLVVPLFGELFYWWHEKCFSSRLMGLNWGMCDNIKKLKDWFDNNASEEDKKKWKERAKESPASQAST
ncbi:hypothetical protein [Halomonas korlensis]|uniref:DUF4760 domain-containing protein n=1 Tax=Halomonas korlensis TaxID=463301 RepID=A0A1I7J3X2_9GAMM|nr:hypothetical protein [Halomonas korlensis]SFU79878.1 hypothetical protein SAMN04487955_10944 [Halomonas korlensis]